VNHLWSFSGDDTRSDVEAAFAQPFASKGLGQGRTLSINFESSYDWETSQWSIPVNVGYSKASRVGKQLVSYQGGARYDFEVQTAVRNEVFDSRSPCSSPRTDSRFSTRGNGLDS
jgi:hypothetical protein